LIWELDAEVDCLNPEGESRARKINSKEHEDLFNGELELQARKMLFDAQKSLAWTGSPAQQLSQHSPHCPFNYRPIPKKSNKR
jgi:hypothetical protein